MFALRQAHERNGLLFVLSRAVVLMPAAGILELQDELTERMGARRAREFVILLARKRTQASTGRLRLLRTLNVAFEKLHAGHPVYDLGSQIWQMTGWGKYYVRRYDAAKIVVASPNSVIAEARLTEFGSSRVPVCDYTWGMIAGVLEQMHGDRYSGGETACRATGRRKECVFEFEPARRKA